MAEETNQDEMVGYRQQPGKLPFAKPGSGGKDRFSSPRDEEMIPKSPCWRSNRAQQIQNCHRHIQI